MTGATLTAAIAGGAVQSVPSGLAVTVATAALSSATLAGVSATPLGYMSLKPVLATLGAVGAASVILYQHTQLRSVHDANAALMVRAERAERTAQETDQRLRTLQQATENDPRIAELAKLRGEVAGLRREAIRLKAENGPRRSSVREAAPAAEPEASEMDVVKDAGIARMNYAKQWMLALVLHAEDHDGRLPDSLDQAGAYFRPAGSADLSPTQAEFYRALTTDQLELTYRGALADLKNPGNTIVVREREAWVVPGRPGLARTYGFADGHSEIHYAQDGKFDDWERERSAAP